ncbi:WXG100 family type VII secretion target [Segniliparus rugosus]|uniref:ESAT-6-like protein n=1 Tax=Segniliparus rugosus (strain ATCC BAA-974 / DSM 45345 / CCUG 50838 / CIP 108380 / JCM 13579 / CDC 945) TaxID=679197 RepID=E5XLT8_SEGRC|nr:WXG100 family type VII secretion target [Segniliparus rugosus]EFV14684.1 WXG100 family type VII secretion target [Segniliparus rugosus ATCC BAA-974]
MTQIMYTYPAMLAQAAEMNGFAAALQVVGADVASEQASLAGAWQGDTGTSYQAWQTRWNQSMEELVMAYRAMASSYEQNTLSMNARDMAEGAKWM